MPVVPYQPLDLQEPTELVGSIRKRRGGALLNLDRMLLHSPAFAAGWNSFLAAVRTSLTVPGQLRELAICAVAILNKAEYEFQQHAPEFLREGGRETQLAALRLFETLDDLEVEFSPQEQATLQLCREMTRAVRVSKETMQAVKQVLDSDQQLVELVGIIATYNMVSRFLVALEIELE